MTRHALFFATLLLVGGGCGAAARPPSPLRVTAPVAAPCGPDWLERHARSASDLDGDGVLDRPSVVRAGANLEVRLHALPTLAETHVWTIPDGYVELATPRRRGSAAGDLWLSVGRGDDKPWDGSTEPASLGWVETLYHLEDDALVPVISGYRDIDIHVDVDGDGTVDPIGSRGGVVEALLGGEWVDVPVLLTDWIHGAPLQHGQEEAVDLDGDGVRELVLQTDAGVSIVEVPSFRTVWSVAGAPWEPRLLWWGDALVLAVRLDGVLRVFATDAAHAELAAFPEAATYAEARPWIDAATGRAQLLVTGHPAKVYDRGQPTTPIATLPRLAERLGVTPPALAPAPLHLLQDDFPFVWQHTVTLVDVDGDGTDEVLVQERSSFESSGHAVDTLRMRVLDARGATRWEEPNPRTQEWTITDGDLREVKPDDTHVRALDLGDGTLPLRIRSDLHEYYLLAPRSTLTTIPPCLE